MPRIRGFVGEDVGATSKVAVPSGALSSTGEKSAGVDWFRFAQPVSLRPARTAFSSTGGENGQEWIRTTEGKSQQIYSLLSNRVNLTFTAN